LFSNNVTFPVHCSLYSVETAVSIWFKIMVVITILKHSLQHLPPLNLVVKHVPTILFTKRGGEGGR